MEKEASQKLIFWVLTADGQSRIECPATCRIVYVISYLMKKNQIILLEEHIAGQSPVLHIISKDAKKYHNSMFPTRLINYGYTGRPHHDVSSGLSCFSSLPSPSCL